MYDEETGNCRSCHAKVFWAFTDAFKHMPIDIAETPGGNVKLWRDEGDKLRASVVKVGEGTYVSHFATCENAQRHRQVTT